MWSWAKSLFLGTPEIGCCRAREGSHGAQGSQVCCPEQVVKHRISPCLAEGKPTPCGHKCGFPASHPTPSPLGHRSDRAQSCPCSAAGTGPVKIFHSCRHPPCRKHYYDNIQRTLVFFKWKMLGGVGSNYFFPLLFSAFSREFQLTIQIIKTRVHAKQSISSASRKQTLSSGFPKL